MRFLKVHPQLAINVESIEVLNIAGQEGKGSVQLRALTENNTYVVSRHKDFRSAEIALMELIDRLEDD